MERTELQNRAYKHHKKKSKISFATRLGYQRSEKNGMIHEFIAGSRKQITIFDTPEFFVRKIETVDYPGDTKYEPQKVWLGYKGIEHYLLIPINQNKFSYARLGEFISAIPSLGYNVEINSVSHQSVPEVFHLHVFKKPQGQKS